MKKLSVAFLSFCLSAFSFAQNPGKISSIAGTPMVGALEQYIYDPPIGLLMPDSLEALIMYNDKPYSKSNFVRLRKMGRKYSFTFKANDYVAVLLMVIIDARMKLSDFSPLVLPKKKVVDNNNGEGFVIHLQNKAGIPFADDAIQLAGLLPRWVYYMDIKEPSNTHLLTFYETAYEKQPELKEKDSYIDYLSLLYKEKQERAKPLLMNYATEKIKNGAFETDLLMARKVYAILKSVEEQKKTEELILQKHPAGELAKEKFWSNQYAASKKPGQTEESILAEMDDYNLRFKDSSRNGFFYQKIISLFFDKGDWDGGLKYEDLYSAKVDYAYINNQYALKLADASLDSTGHDLQTAKILSLRTLGYIKAYKDKNKDASDDIVKYLMNRYFNTYALVLYKLGQVDSAFYYQDAVYKLGNILNAEGLARYALYAEKIKGANHARQILEEQLLNGINSPAMLDQLQEIYKKLNLPEDQLKILEERNRIFAERKNAETVKKTLGSNIAKGFELKNMKGATVSLASLRNKIVVLDFWATWCAPCKASFPEMQKLVNKYKNDDEVTFLFIDVWEKQEPKKLKENIAAYLEENEFTFNVLLDEKNKAVEGYKIISIPQKFVIDKEGKIVYMQAFSNSETDMAKVIEATKKKGYGNSQQKNNQPVKKNLSSFSNNQKKQ